MSAVSTINLNNFLVQKDSGDVVTGADWNKLVALFHTVNNNANALIATNQNVGVNAANIAQISLGAVPDNSVGYSKLEKAGNTKGVYTLVEDAAPTSGVTYFTLENGAYKAHSNLTEFKVGVQYYVLETVPTQPAVAAPDVIGDNIIMAKHCAEMLLGGLLNDSVTVYTDKAVHIAFETAYVDSTKNAPTVARTITFEKQHKAFIIMTSHTISFLCAAPDKPDVYIGLSAQPDGDPGQLVVKCLIGDNKLIGAPQNLVYSRNPASYAYAPRGLTKNSVVRLQRCHYNYDTKSIEAVFEQCYAGITAADQYIYPAVEDTFGSLIIGL